MPPPKKTSKPAPVQTVQTPSPAPMSAAAPIATRSEIKGSSAPKTPASAPRQISHDEISRRAYEIYAGRGYAAGDQNADWLEAERQLKAGL
ncbi:MAG TPA: DUF2934 domain-containing protein [Phycisphaerae bacterium]|jgi:hypothetical protein